MNGESAPTQDVTAGVPVDFGVARAVTSTIALGLQIAGLYAAFATFGAWVTVGFYTVGGLAAVLPYLALRRATQ